MSWAEEDWTVGLSGRVLQKVKELQVHQERLSRENKQKQLQLDNIHTSLEKQTVKYEEVRGELQCVQRELQSVREEAKAAVTSSERLTQELQTKQAQVCSLEGQLDAARTLNNKLTQEIKKLEAELEKLQNSSRSADTTLFSTPCWNTTSPWENSGSKKEERPGHRDEGQSRALHIRRLQFPEVGTTSLPRQQHKSTPHRHPSDQSDTFSTPLAAFPWERDDSRSAAKRSSPSSPHTPCTDVISQQTGQAEQRVYGKEKEHKTETDASLSEVRGRVSALEEELCAKAASLKSLQNEMVQSKKELAAREISLHKARDELSMAHTRMAQESERASGAEHRLKQLQEELKCQRQNAESSRLQHQQRSKEMEKHHQRDLAELQKERQCLEKQHQQEVNKLNQELQQARTLHNALQAQADKLSLQKQALDKELDSLKEKLKWTEGQLQESQKKEAQTQAKLTEALREADGVAVSLEQSRKRERALEEEGVRLSEERADALRLLKELQEEKAAPLQPVQFCPIGQSFSPQSSYPLHSRPSAHVKRPSTATLAEQKRDENIDVDKRRAEIAASYPSDREPGEGIDSEHINEMISSDSESLQQKGLRRSSNETENKIRNEDKNIDSTTLDEVLSCSSHSEVSLPINKKDGDDPSVKAFDDLKRENATLRSELQDAREELQKRLEDLEVQRRAETEARTRLKQLSRKRASQASEKDEQDKEWRAQLESERAETDRLRRAMAALETELKRVREDREEQVEGKNEALQDRESEMIELNIQLKKQLAELKAQLALEQEERKRDEEERNQITNRDLDGKKELSMKLQELKAELEELKRSREEDSLEAEKLLVANIPLTYLTLHDDELNSNILLCDNKHLPSPEQQLLFCQSANQRNMLVSQAAADIIKKEQAVIDPECSLLSNEGQTDQEASDLDDDRQNYLGEPSLSDLSLSDDQKVEHASSDLAKELQQLQKEYTKETERANQYQVKLETLQSQVTRQTKQLTMAFERQSQHISGLLAELQEKESALLSQGETLQGYKKELDALKAEKEGGEKARREDMAVKEVEERGQKEETQDEKSRDISGLQSNQENEHAVSVLTTNSLEGCDTQRDAGQREIVASGAERPAAICDESDGEAKKSVCLAQDSAFVMGDAEHLKDGQTADMFAELFALRQENQLLKQRIESLAVSDSRTIALHTDRGDPVKQSQNSGSAALSCLVEQRSHTVLNDITTDAQQSLPEDVKSIEDVRGDLEQEVGRTERAKEELEAELQINRLQQQVEELQMRLKDLSAETQQQNEELIMWRLASHPPTFEQFHPNTHDQSETQNQTNAVRKSQSNQHPTDEMDHIETQIQASPGSVRVVREDELFLSCSSNKLQGRMLFSRLQHSNLVEPKSLHLSKRTAALQGYNQDTVTIDKESEKENQEINLLNQLHTGQPQQKEKGGTDVIQLITSGTTGQPHISAPKQTKTAECYVENPKTKSEAPRATNEKNTANDFPGRYVRTEMKTVSSQTEESLCPRSAPPASELHCAYTQTEEEEEEEEEEEDGDELVESPSVSPVPLSDTAGSGDKVLFSGSFPIPADPARLAERIRRNRTQLSAAFDDTEYEPYGLPEVVMKGFADIPSGPSCPYIVRRGLLGTTVVPAPQKDGTQEEETD